MSHTRFRLISNQNQSP